MRKDSHNLHKKHQDIISQLPDDILISIISRLTLREATVTSILSTRWQYLHTYNTHLDFPPFNLEKEHLQNYINTVVNRVLDSHKGGKVRVLKVHTNKASFHKCLKFALTKKAEIIHIRKRGRVCHDCFLRLASNLNIIRLLPAGLTRLKELSLERVDVDDQDFEILVSNSLALESLSIMYTKYLTNVKVVGHPKLKHLDISSAWKLKSIEIRDVINLVSLKLYELSQGYDFQLSNIPNFIKFDYKEFFGQRPYVELFAKMPCCIRDQLQLLHLSTSLHSHDHKLMNNQWFEFVNVKHLELELDMRGDYAPIYLLYPLLEACRSLEKLEIKLLWRSKPRVIEEILINNTYRRFLPKKLSPKLEQVEMIGYLGRPNEVKLASYIINNAASLRELIVVTAFDSRKKGEYRFGFDRARRQFHQIIPSSSKINFSIV